MSSPCYYLPVSIDSSNINFFTIILFVFKGLTLASDVGGVPSFRSVPTTVKTSEHDTVLLPCYVDNLGANVIRWWKDGEVIWDTGNTSLIAPANVRMFASNNTLEVSDVSSTDTGEYICQVVRPEPWGPLNQVHAIEVQFPPTVSSIPESGELEVPLQEEVVMGCTSTGVPPPAINWFFEGKDMQLLISRATLSFQVTDRKMAGEYQCIANNGVGEPAVASILLKVTYPPEVSANKLWIHTSPGLRAELSCTVHSNPDAKVEWYKNGTVVDALPRIVPARINDRHLLIIRNVRASDLGYYTCKATNGIGHGQQMIQLSGVANVAVFKKNIKQSGKTNYTLVWEVDSYSAIIEYSLLFRHHGSERQVEWTKLVIPADPYGLGPLHTQLYTLTGLKNSLTYEASVLARNRFGWSRPSELFLFSTSGTDLSKDEDDNNDDGHHDDEDNINVNDDDEKSENILSLDRNTIQTVLSAEFDVSYNTESMKSSTVRFNFNILGGLLISSLLILRSNYCS